MVGVRGYRWVSRSICPAWLNARLWEMKRVLKPTGSIYVHCDWHASHYIKCEIDKLLGYDVLQNEVV